MKQESTGREMRTPPLSKLVTKSYSLLYAVDIIAQKENKEVQLCFWLSSTVAMEGLWYFRTRRAQSHLGNLKST